MSLQDARKTIDEIDNQIVDLFLRRMHAASEAAKAKEATGAPVLDAGRERDILYRVAEQAGPEMERYAKALYTTLFDVSRSYQRGRRDQSSPLAEEIQRAVERNDAFPTKAVVACQGVEGAYSQQACSRMFEFPGILYFQSFDAVFSAVEQGMCRYGVLPIENSTAGSVSQVYDLMQKHSFSIVRGIRQRIDHVLLTKQGIDSSSVKEVFSHPHALAQCGEYIKRNPNICFTPVENTALAAQMVAESSHEGVAAIASAACAKLYDLKVQPDTVADTDHNYTRFICISKDMQIFPGANKISLMASLSHRPGSLYSLLSRFAAMGINLTKLESRPAAGKDFTFRFYLDFEAYAGDPAVTALLRDIQAAAESFEFLGCYQETY